MTIASPKSPTLLFTASRIWGHSSAIFELWGAKQQLKTTTKKYKKIEEEVISADHLTKSKVLFFHTKNQCFNPKKINEFLKKKLTRTSYSLILPPSVLYIWVIFEIISLLPFRWWWWRCSNDQWILRWCSHGYCIADIPFTPSLLPLYPHPLPKPLQSPSEVPVHQSTKIKCGIVPSSQIHHGESIQLSGNIKKNGKALKEKYFSRIRCTFFGCAITYFL